jgi:hypothetical protein
MARKRTELSAAAKKTIAKMLERGATAEAVSKALKADGISVSTSTIARRMREVRGAVAAPRVSASESLRKEYADAADAAGFDEDEDEELPELEKIPPDADIRQLDRWIRRVDKMGKIAGAKGDLHGMGQMGRLLKGLHEAKLKATPPSKDDPRDNPDRQATIAEMRKKLHLYIDQALGK